MRSPAATIAWLALPLLAWGTGFWLVAAEGSTPAAALDAFVERWPELPIPRVVIDGAGQGDVEAEASEALAATLKATHHWDVLIPDFESVTDLR